MSNQSAYSLTLKNSIASCMTGISASNIIDLVVSSPTRRLTSTLSSSSSSSLATSYSVSTTQTGVTYSSLSSQLETNIANGEFDSFLNYYATVYNTPGFVNATSTSASTVNDLASTSSNNDNSGLNDGEIAGIVIGVTAALVLFCAFSYYFVYYHSSTSSKKKSSTSHGPGGGKTSSVDEDVKKTEMRPSGLSAPRKLSDSSITTMDTLEAAPVVGVTHNILHEAAAPVTSSGVIVDKAENN
jgi:hypothetical protein